MQASLISPHSVCGHGVQSSWLGAPGPGLSWLQPDVAWAAVSAEVGRSDSRVAQTRGRQGAASCWQEVPLPVCLCTEPHEYLLAWQTAYLEEVVQESKAGAPMSVTT